MSPLQVRVMLHYHYSPNAWEGPEDEAYMITLHEQLVNMGMLAHLRPWDEYGPKYEITPKGAVYVKMVLDVPVPIVQYIDPRSQ